MKKALKSITICFIIIALLSTSVFAASPIDSISPLTNEYIARTTVGIAALGNRKIVVDCSITAMGIVPDVGVYWIALYKEDGTRVGVHYFTETGYSYLMDHNSGKHTTSVTFPVTPGQRYYARVCFLAGEYGVSVGIHTMASTIITAT